jgi:N-acetylmuramoyl-L-alanine amidase
VLIETAYISNAEEEKLLKNRDFQKKLAAAIVSSAIEYLSGAATVAQGNSTSEGSSKVDSRDRETIPGKVNDVQHASRLYTVKKGDTVYSLAKSNSITIDELRKLNNMHENAPLLLGQKIKLP